MLRTFSIAIVVAVASFLTSSPFAANLISTSTESLVAKVNAEYPAFFKNDPELLPTTINTGVNFGTDMVIVIESCGNDDCQTGLAINVNTSEIIKLPTASYGGYDFRRDYSLLVVNPNPRDYLVDHRGTKKLPAWLYREMYTVEQGKFVKFHQDRKGPTTDKTFVGYYITPASD